MVKKEEKIEDTKEGQEIKKALSLSIREGASASVMTGTGNSFITPFALSIGANNFQIGFLSSFVGLVGPLTQLYNSRAIEKYSRKKVVMLTVLLQALLWIPIIVLGMAYYFGFFVDYLPWLLILFYSVHIGIGAIAGPVWFSWMGDLVPEKFRGDYFSKRNKIVTTVSVIMMLIAGFFLDFFRTNGSVLIGFSILFSIAMLARIYSVFIFRKQYCPKLELPKDYYFSFREFVARALTNNFGKFVFFMGFFYFAVSIASPFFAVYMLKELEFNYLWFTIITLSSSVFSIIAMTFWGKFSDKYGNRLVLVISSVLISFVPIFWLFSSSKLYIIFVPQLVGGLAWGGFNLAAFNFIYDSVTPPKRALCSIYNNVFVGMGIFVGAMAGGAVARYTSFNLFGSSLIFLFLISAFARLIVSVSFLKFVKEVRVIDKPPMLIRDVRFTGLMENGLHRARDAMMHLETPEKRIKKNFKRVEKIFVKNEE